MKLKERGRNEDYEGDKIPSKPDPMIPFDVVVEILARLPAKSLIKFRCVSKIWSSITRTQRFVDSFYAISSTRPRFMIAVSGAKRLIIFSSSLEGEASSSLVAKLDMVIPNPSENMFILSNCLCVHGFLGSCWGSSFTICNPTSGQVFTFPCKGTYSFLGYDPISGQFKALILMRNDRGYLEAQEVITLGGAGGETRKKVTTPFPHLPLSKGLCINGFVYYGALFPITDPMIVYFDVRYEKLSVITTPKGVLHAPSGLQEESILIEYKGKLASITPHRYSFRSIDLWILEDVTKHDWSKQTFELPLSFGVKVTSHGTNKAGEIIFVPETLPYTAQPFYIYYYNVERNDIRRVPIHGIADHEGFRNNYGLIGYCRVYISPQHVESIASF